MRVADMFGPVPFQVSGIMMGAIGAKADQKGDGGTI